MSGAAQFFIEGGPWMIPIGLISILVLAVAVERVIFLFFRYNINGQAFMAQVTKLVLANNIDRSIKLCNAAPNAALPRIVKAGLTRANKGEIEIQNAVEIHHVQSDAFRLDRDAGIARCAINFIDLI